LCLATVEAADLDYLVLVFENVFEQGAQYLATLGECSSCPDFLFIASSIDSTVNVCKGCWYYLGSQASAICRATRKYIAIADLVLISVYLKPFYTSTDLGNSLSFA
jgi:hypothetical protein